MGASTEYTDVLAFAPTPAGVKTGDTVTFVNTSSAPHHRELQRPRSTTRRTRAPTCRRPARRPRRWAATGFFNSGLLPPDAPPGKGPPLAARSFSFKVTTAGDVQLRLPAPRLQRDGRFDHRDLSRERARSLSGAALRGGFLRRGGRVRA